MDLGLLLPLRWSEVFGGTPQLQIETRLPADPEPLRSRHHHQIITLDFSDLLHKKIRAKLLRLALEDFRGKSEAQSKELHTLCLVWHPREIGARNPRCDRCGHGSCVLAFLSNFQLLSSMLGSAMRETCSLKVLYEIFGSCQMQNLCFLLF